MTGSTEG